MGKLITYDDIYKKYKHIIGLKKGLRTVIDVTEVRASNGDIQCILKCECGSIKPLSISRFLSRNTYSCGCVPLNKFSKEDVINKYKYLIGEKINNWTVINITGEKNNNGQYTATCKCNCESETVKEVLVYALINKTAISCGCVGNCAKLKHGDTKERLYKIWCDMRKRCRADKGRNFEHYKGKGIKVCEEWDKSYEAFKEWSLKNGYNNKLTIDRIDVTKGYEPDNCRWATWTTQQNNKNNNKYYKVNGENKTISELSREYNMTYEIIRGRLRRGWNIEEALGIKSRNQIKRKCKRFYTVKYNGEEYNLKEICNILNKNYSRILYKASKGEDIYTLLSIENTKGKEGN